jgi:heptaprenyl diphosphate synthase
VVPVARPVLAADLATLEASVRARLDCVEAALAEAVASADPFVQEAAGYLVRAGGKRFRSTLLLICGHLGDPAEPRLTGASVAIELTHLSTLYHDDVMDEAEVRRGEHSANARYDNKIAILTGDYLFARASDVTADLGTEPTRVLARAIGRLVQGEIREVRGARPGEDPVEHYLGVLRDKTGALIAAACRLGAWLAGAPAAEVEALTKYGERVGVAFQLGDDLLDITAETAVAGKEPGTDLRAGVRTLPVLFVFRRGGRQAERLARLLEAGCDDAEAVAEALSLLRHSPALAEARAVALAEADRAKAALATLPRSAPRLALEAIAGQVFDRQV